MIFTILKNLKGYLSPMLWMIIGLILVVVFIAIYLGVSTYFTNINIPTRP